MGRWQVYRFDWDPVKAAGNRRKHGVSFIAAASVFGDPLSLSRYDTAHCGAEERWVTLGQSGIGPVLVVAHTFEETSAREARVRIISARFATASERRQYQGVAE